MKNKKNSLKSASNDQSVTKFSNHKAIHALENFFKFDKYQAVWKKEILGGLSTFLALVYILSVNPAILSQAKSIDWTETNPVTMNYFGIFFAGAIVSILGSLAMGLFANVPIVMSTTMGMNTLFTYSIANAGLGFEGAMIAITFSSILFVIVTVTPMRRIILKAIPNSLAVSFAVAIGFFIAYVGLQQMFWLKPEMNDGKVTGLPVAALSNLKTTYPMILIGTGTLALMLIFHFKKVPGGVALAIVIGFIIALIVANTVKADSYLVANGGAFQAANFRSGFSWNYDFAGFGSNIKKGWTAFTNPKIWTSPIFYISILVVMFMSFFDDSSTLTTLNMQLNKKTNAHPKINNRALIVDAVSGTLNGVLGTSSMGVMVESSAGITQDSRTGVGAIVNALMFALAIGLFPIFQAIPTFVTGAACIYIGIAMIASITEIEWKKPEFAISAFLTIIFVVVTYTIINGVAIGIISYAFVMLVTKKGKMVSWLVWPLALVLILYFVALAFIQ